MRGPALSNSACGTLSVLTFLFLTLNAIPLRAAITTIALSGDPSPDGDGLLDALELPVVNNNGWVAFQARTSGHTNLFHPELLLVGSGSNLIQIARGGFEDPISFDVPAFNVLGQMAIGGSTNILTTQPGPLRADTNGVAFFAQLTDVDPDSVGIFDYFGRVSINDPGVGAFSGRVKIDDFNVRVGVYVSDGTNISSYAVDGDTPAGTTNEFVAFGNPVALNNSNQVAFLAGTTGDSGGAERGVYLADGTSIVVLAHAGDVAPGGGVFEDFLAPVINEAGQVGFYATLEGVGGGPQGIWLADTSSVQVVAMDGQLAPGGNPFEAFTQPVINDEGYVAFKGFTTAEDGLFLGNTNSMTALVVDKDPAPDGNGQFGFTSTITGLPVLNNRRQVVFLAKFNTSGDSDTGIVFVSTDGTTRLVARGGQALEGSTITELDLFGDAVFEQDFGGRNALNERGQVTFHATLADGREGVFLWTPPGPKAQLPTFDGNDVVITVQSLEGPSYQLERRKSLGGGVWIEEGSPVAGTGGEIYLRHVGGTLIGGQYYRIAVLK